MQLLRDTLGHHDRTPIKKKFSKKNLGGTQKGQDHLYNYAGILQFFTAKWKWLKSQGSKAGQKGEWNVLLCKYKKSHFSPLKLF